VGRTDDIAKSQDGTAPPRKTVEVLRAPRQQRRCSSEVCDDDLVPVLFIARAELPERENGTIATLAPTGRELV